MVKQPSTIILLGHGVYSRDYMASVNSLSAILTVYSRCIHSHFLILLFFFVLFLFLVLYFLSPFLLFHFLLLFVLSSSSTAPPILLLPLLRPPPPLRFNLLPLISPTLPLLLYAFSSSFSFSSSLLHFFVFLLFILLLLIPFLFFLLSSVCYGRRKRYVNLETSPRDLNPRLTGKRTSLLTTPPSSIAVHHFSMPRPGQRTSPSDGFRSTERAPC